MARQIERRAPAMALAALLAGAAACNGLETPRIDSGGGASGTAAHLVACPPDPTGACTMDGQTCEYPTQTCACGGGAWACTACPAARPGVADACPAGSGQVLPFRCGYGDLSCSCDEYDFNPLAGWQCGACPATPPAMSEACGNTSFSCAYADQLCICGQEWSCIPFQCDPSEFGHCRGVSTCAFPALDQVCSCQGGSALRKCTCPAALPAQGSACAGSATGCKYGDQTCECSDTWSCVAACPDAQPVAGTACTSALTCSYPGGLCYCAGGSWHC